MLLGPGLTYSGGNRDAFFLALDSGGAHTKSLRWGDDEDQRARAVAVHAASGEISVGGSLPCRWHLFPHQSLRDFHCRQTGVHSRYQINFVRY